MLPLIWREKLAVDGRMVSDWGQPLRSTGGDGNQVTGGP